MAGLVFLPVDEFRRQADSIVATAAAVIERLLGKVEIYHIGATAIPGSLTKGDVDVLVRVSREDFPAAVAACKGRYAIHQLENWNDDFASFKDEITFSMDGVAVRRVENTHWHQPLNLIFDSETMPDWFGMPDDADLPSTFSVEYVRAWKRK